jgi:ATP-binding cassette, subfamily B, bacterial
MSYNTIANLKTKKNLKNVMPKFPHSKQLDSMDCGPTCLRMVAKYYGKSYSLQYLRSQSYITREGVSMLGISEAAENIGFRTRGYRLTWEELRDEVPLPASSTGNNGIL